MLLNIVKINRVRWF